MGCSDPSGDFAYADEDQRDLVRMILGSTAVGFGFSLALSQSTVAPIASSDSLLGGGSCSFEHDNPHHVLHGTKKRHEAEWNRFGINPNDPDDGNWLKLIPILEETVRKGEEVSRKIIQQTGEAIVQYEKYYAEFNARVVV